MTSEPGPAGSTATDHEDAVFEAATRWLRALLVKIARLCSAMPDSDLDEESGRDAPCRGIRNPPAGRPAGTVAPRASSLRPCGRRR